MVEHGLSSVSRHYSATDDPIGNMFEPTQDAFACRSSIDTGAFNRERWGDEENLIVDEHLDNEIFNMPKYVYVELLQRFVDIHTEHALVFLKNELVGFKILNQMS